MSPAYRQTFFNFLLISISSLTIVNHCLAALPLGIQHQYVGCFKDDPENADFENEVWTRDLWANVGDCIDTCRQQSYNYAGLSGGNKCLCTNNNNRLHGKSTQCKLPCAANPDQICGGHDGSNSVYKIEIDKFQGCFNDLEADRDLKSLQWTFSDGKSAAECISKCKLVNFKYAGIQEGGTCFCGNSFGKHGRPNNGDKWKCSMKCASAIKGNCGGNLQNAVYRTEISTLLNSPDVNDTLSNIRLYDIANENLNAIETRIFTTFPNLRSVVTRKLIIDTDHNPIAPLQDTQCSNNCYKECGNIYQPDGLIDTGGGDHVIARYFFLNLAELPTLLKKEGKSAAKTVQIYAQTILINRDISVPFALMIKARQILLDRSLSKHIQVSNDAIDLPIDLQQARIDGPTIDLFFKKQSVMCAKILLETKNNAHINTAWQMIDWMANDRPLVKEDAAYTNSIRAYKAEMVGIARDDVNFVPFYTKSYLATVLKNYYEKISVYKADFDQMRHQSVVGAQFNRIVRGMLTINVETDIAEARSSFDASINALKRSNVTYARIKEQYVYSRMHLETARKNFEAELKRLQGWSIADGVLGFIRCIFGVVFGSIRLAAGDMTGITDLVDSVADIAATMANLAEAMANVKRFTDVSDQLLTQMEDLEQSYDFHKFQDHIEIAAQLRVNIVRWKNLKNAANTLLTKPLILDISGSAQYRRRFLDVANWGEAVTKSVVERAELFRKAVAARKLLESKREQAARYDAYLRQLENGNMGKGRMVTLMAQQTYDVRLDLNEMLITFCRAFFYENLAACKPSYKPQFGGSLSELLIRINAARRDALFLPDAPSTTKRTIVIKDEPGTSVNCTDSMICPITYLKKNRHLIWNLDTDHVAISDLSKYRVAEILLNFVGAKRSESNSKLKVRIQSSGDFQGRERSTVYNFVTRPLALTFEYDLVDGEISIHADVYAPFRNIVNHITPYTTWMIRISDDRSSDIDFSSVTELRMRLDGSAIDDEDLIVE